ncbi:hypothetical protein BX616_006533, partial [Lobosporangium transversale]
AEYTPQQVTEMSGQIVEQSQPLQWSEGLFIQPNQGLVYQSAFETHHPQGHTSNEQQQQQQQQPSAMPPLQVAALEAAHGSQVPTNKRDNIPLYLAYHSMPMEQVLDIQSISIMPNFAPNTFFDGISPISSPEARSPATESYFDITDDEGAYNPALAGLEHMVAFTNSASPVGVFNTAMVHRQLSMQPPPMEQWSHPFPLTVPGPFAVEVSGSSTVAHKQELDFSDSDATDIHNKPKRKRACTSKKTNLNKPKIKYP